MEHQVNTVYAAQGTGAAYTLDTPQGTPSASDFTIQVHADSLSSTSTWGLSLAAEACSDENKRQTTSLPSRTRGTILPSPQIAFKQL